MTLIGLILALIIIGVLLWLLNTLMAAYMDPKILTIINAVVVIAVLLWLVSIFVPAIDIPIRTRP